VAAAFPRVGSRQPHVGDPPLVVVVGQADKRPRRQFDHHRASRAQVEDAARVRGIGVQREPHMTGLRHHQQSRLVVGCPRRPGPADDPFQRHRRVEEVISLQGSPPVLLAVHHLGTRLRGEVVLELHGARHTGIHPRPAGGWLHPGRVKPLRWASGQALT
jgi:hypothetical protein